MPTPHFERGTLTEREKEKRGDVFKPPYNPNLYVGEVQDEEEGTEYVVLVSELVCYLGATSTRTEAPLVVPCTLHLASLPTVFDACFVAQQVLCRRGAFSSGHQTCVLGWLHGRHAEIIACFLLIRLFFGILP